MSEEQAIDPNRPLIDEQQFTDISSPEPDTEAQKKKEPRPASETPREPHILTDDQLLECTRAFKFFDKNDDDCISADELITAMRFLDQNPSEQEVREMIAKVTNGENDVITKDQFITMLSKCWKSKAQSKMEMLAAFQVLDEDGNGKIVIQELKNIICKLGEKISEEEADAVFAMADINKDGVIDYNEFVEVLGRK